jgi:hypothetical protein
MGGLLVEPVPPFRARAQWAVSEGGRIGIVLPDPFSVEFLNGTSSTRTTRLAHTPLRVTDGHKREWRESQTQVQLVPVRSRSGAVEMRRLQQPYTEPETWPATLPPFLENALRFDGQDRLWIKRTTAPGERETHDVVNTDGQLVRRVVLKAREYLIGLGRNSVYVVTLDADDLQYLVRYPLP